MIGIVNDVIVADQEKWSLRNIDNVLRNIHCFAWEISRIILI
jgi:hypothetical protein